MTLARPDSTLVWLVGTTSLIAAALGLVTHGVAAEATDEDVLAATHAEANAIADAVLEGNFELLVSKMHPQLVYMMGGAENAIENFSSSRERLLKKGIRTTGFEVEQADRVYRVIGVVYVIVPYVMTTDTPESIIKRHAYLFMARLDTEDGWLFLDSLALPNEAAVRKLLPLLPPGFEFPETKTDVTEKPPAG